MIWAFLDIVGIATAIMLIVTAFEHPDTKLCESCEYDLRGLPSRRCPECGYENASLAAGRRRVRHPVMFAIGLGLLLVCMAPVAIILYAIVSFVLFGGGIS